MRMNLSSVLRAAALSLPLLAAGCGAEKLLFGDAGGGTGDAAIKTDGGAGGDMAVTLFVLEPGTYKITKIGDKVDGCMIDSDPMDPILGSSYTLTNDDKGNIALKGVQSGTVFGAGAISFNKGVLTAMGKYDSMSGCTWDWSIKWDVEITADNMITAKFTEDDTNRAMACLPMIGATCKTTWTVDLAKQP